jgi:diguanylate cyclase (GGDEF)-like protein
MVDTPELASGQPRNDFSPFLYEVSHLHELTGLPNRHVFNYAVQSAIDNPHVHGTFGIMLVDLDGLKEVNDTLGHDEGNLYLQETAHVLRDISAESEYSLLVTHLSGDEFALLVRGIRSADDLSRVKNNIQMEAEELGIGMSIGGKLHEGETASALLSEADARMYMDKIQRKLEKLTPAQRRLHMYIGELAMTHGISLRDIPIVYAALKAQLMRPN